MRRFDQLQGVAAALPIDNVDTDKILPADYLKTVSRAGLGQWLFARMRYRDDGSEQSDFVLNRVPWRDAVILITGANFGCGSSREHAPWALADFGIRCIIAESFADIFYNNCSKNGILPIVLGEPGRDELLRLAEHRETATLKVDLESQVISNVNGHAIPFAIDAGLKRALIRGRDDIAETLSLAAELDAWDEQSPNQGSDVRGALAALGLGPSSHRSGT